MKDRILVVEDNPLNSCAIGWRWKGYEVLVASDLNAAFAAVRAQPPGAVLLDVQLGTDDGLSLASWMRQQAVLCKIPIIAVTAEAMVTEQQHILESGCSSIVPKPVNFSVLQQQLRFWLGRAEALQENQLPGKK